MDLFGLISIINTPVLFWATQTFVSKEKCQGANDNLSGVITALTLARYFSQHNSQHTEIWCVAFGTEEAGQREFFKLIV